MDELDIEWFEKQEEIERAYDIFYEKPLNSVWISILYVNNNNVVHVTRKQHTVYNNNLTHNDIDEIISKHRILNGTKYRFYAMAKFNVTISPKQILNSDYTTNYFTTLEQLQDITFNDTISYLEDDNELFIVLTSQENSSTTRRIRLIHTQKTRRKHYSKKN